MRTSPITHVAIIPDGNRRWARERGLPTIEGHRRGFARARELTKKSRELGIKILSLWAFSTENWKRSKDEVGYLMRIYEKWIDDYLTEAIEDEVRLKHIGRTDRIPPRLLAKIRSAEEKTKDFTKNILVLALDYGGQDEIVRGIRKMFQDKMFQDKVDIQSIDEKYISSYLDTADIPNPDLIIRTSGEQRLSGFLLWASAYAELLFVKEHFPDFTCEKFAECIQSYQTRTRRFGK